VSASPKLADHSFTISNVKEFAKAQFSSGESRGLYPFLPERVQSKDFKPSTDVKISLSVMKFTMYFTCELFF